MKWQANYISNVSYYRSPTFSHYLSKLGFKLAVADMLFMVVVAIHSKNSSYLLRLSCLCVLNNWIGLKYIYFLCLVVARFLK